MSNYGTTRLLTPSKEEEIYPYHPVWPPVIVISVSLIGVATVSFVFFELFSIQLLPEVNAVLRYAIALLPMLLWLTLAYRPERNVQIPRSRLMTVAIATGFVAASIGLPFTNTVLRPQEWLSLESAVNRIVGYTLTVGVIQEFLKYLVLRFTVWPAEMRIRQDSVAYGLAAAVGYGTVVSLDYVLTYSATVDAVGVRVLTIFAMNLAGSLVLSYGLAETWFSRATPVLLPITLIVAALITGIAIPIRAGFVNPSLALTVSNTRDILGLGFGAALATLPLLVVLFLYNVAETSEKIALRSLSD